MILTQPALICLETAWRRLIGQEIEETPTTHFAVSTGVADASLEPAVARPGAERERAPAGANAAVTEMSRSIESAQSAPLSATERRARAAALRALALSRGRRFNAARIAFAEAARLDPALDLSRTPAFWKLERGAHEAAVDAYVEVGRLRDAAVLRARVHSTFRPKPIRTPQRALLNP